VTLPNFVVAGAAKCGTSALAHLLRQHPDVFVPAHKEPHYFLARGRALAFRGPGDDDLNDKILTDRSAYERLFADSRDSTAVGEASVFYLTDSDCFRAMADCLEDPRIIVSLRDPVDRAFSAYSHMRLDGREPIDSFRAALDAEQERMAAGWEPIWAYRGLGHYARQLEGLYEHIAPDRVHLVRYDELRAEPLAAMAATYEFLGVAPFEPETAVRVNVSGRPRSRWVHHVLHSRTAFRDASRFFLPQRLRHQLYRWVRNANVTTAPRDEDCLRELAGYYRPEVLALQEMTGWDLSGWWSLRRTVVDRP
jgi:hypothetical protein